jgi:hypothetical protein
MLTYLHDVFAGTALKADADADGVNAATACCTCGGGSDGITTPAPPLTTKRQAIPCFGKLTDFETECVCTYLLLGMLLFVN